MFYIKTTVALVLCIFNFFPNKQNNYQDIHCKKRIPGVVLAFDDRFVDDWSKTDSVFSANGWKASFFVSSYHKLNEQQKLQLLQLQMKGHEIGFHGDNHIAALPYIQQNGLTAYLENEFTQVRAMKQDGFNVTSFAYPSGSRDRTTDSALLEKFSMLRGVASAKNVSDHHTGFYKDSPVIDAVGMEYQYKYFSDSLLIQLLDRARQTNGILVLYGHRPVANPDKTKHEVAWETIETICAYLKHHHMKFYTMSELSKLIN